MKLLVFAGTTEGRRLVESLAGLPVDITASVATKYGREMLDCADGRCRVLSGRMDAAAMESLLRREGYDLVVDATHPYAAVVSENIRCACEAAGVRRMRLLRPASDDGGWERAASHAEAAARLDSLPGNVLLATGSKDLAAYTTVSGFAERLFPRVLPTAGAVEECERLGYRRGHIIAMQGPFSRELNAALIRQFAIRVLITKDGGAAGGFPEKAAAARDTGAVLLVVGRPPEREGVDSEAVAEAIRNMAESRK